MQIRRIAFHAASPRNFAGVTQSIIKFDDDQVPSDATELGNYLATESNYGNIIYKAHKNPSDSWASPFVTGHQYRVNWADDIDFTRMNVEVSDKWQPADEDLLIVLPFTDAREVIDVTRTDTFQ